jgi:hypothetical protein
MAGLAIRSSGSLMIETCRFPGRCAMACRALTAEVIGGFIARMARLAVRSTCSLMIETCRSPCRCAVAGRTLAAEVVGGFVNRMTTGAIPGTCYDMVENHIAPRDRTVAGRTFPSIVIDGLQSSMTGLTGGRGALVNAIGVAIVAFDDGMLAHKRIKCVLTSRAIRWEGYRQGINGRIGIASRDVLLRGGIHRKHGISPQTRQKIIRIHVWIGCESLQYGQLRRK